MSHRIADASAKVAPSIYPLPRMTDRVLLASLGQLTGFSPEVDEHSTVVKSFSSYSARRHRHETVKSDLKYIFKLNVEKRAPAVSRGQIPDVARA